MRFEEMTAEQREKVEQCNTPAEVLELAKAQGHDLSDEELGDIAGGGKWNSTTCPVCGGRVYDATHSVDPVCQSCGWRKIN